MVGRLHGSNLPFGDADDIAAARWPDAIVERAYEAARFAESERQRLPSPVGENGRDMDESAYVASLRPSRMRQVQTGAPFWAQVDIIDVESGDGEAVRTGVERFGIRTRRTHVGQARHLVAALAEETGADIRLLLCHGDDGAIVLPELAEEIERYQPFHRRVTPEDLRSFARFDGQVVIATGCETGHPSLAQAVLDCGAEAYVAPTGAPFGYASYFAPISIFYDLTEQRSMDDAVANLHQRDTELRMWQIYRR